VGDGCDGFSAGDRLYLSPVIDLFDLFDLFDRQIISYAVGVSPNPDLTNTSLCKALATLECEQKPLVHSDPGFHRSGSLPVPQTCHQVPGTRRQRWPR
jgi:hypothetical protein